MSDEPGDSQSPAKQALVIFIMACGVAAMLNRVRFHSMFKTGGERGKALGTSMTERFFSDLMECGAEAVVP
jgi:hypothetical protein